MDSDQNRKRSGWAGVAALTACALASTAMGQATITLVPGIDARKISGDGTTVLGYVPNSGQLALWTQGTGVTPLPVQGNVGAISFDGAVVVGTVFDDSGRHAFRWTAGGGVTLLSAPDDAYQAITAGAMSSDGSIIFGEGTDRSVFRWSAATGAQSISAGNVNDVNGALADGSAALGWTSDDNSTIRPAIFRPGQPPQILLNVPMFGDAQAQSANAAGTIVVGADRRIVGPGAVFRQNHLGTLSVAAMNNMVGASADAGTILGVSFFGSDRIVMWDEANGTRSLKSVLVAAGVDLTGITLNDARGLSANGRVVLGTTDAATPTAFIATVPPPPPVCKADYNGVNGRDLLDIFAFLSDWFAGCP